MRVDRFTAIIQPNLTDLWLVTGVIDILTVNIADDAPAE